MATPQNYNQLKSRIFENVDLQNGYRPLPRRQEETENSKLNTRLSRTFFKKNY